jgi:hypothetical protein
MKLLFDEVNMCRGRPKLALQASGDKNVYYGLNTSGWWAGGMKLFFDDENMCRGRPKIALPASEEQNMYYGSDTSVLWFGH